MSLVLVLVPDLQPDLGIRKQMAKTLIMSSLFVFMFIAWVVMLNFSARLHLEVRIIGPTVRWFMTSKKFVPIASCALAAFFALTNDGSQARQFAVLMTVTSVTAKLLVTSATVATLIVMAAEWCEQRGKG